MIRPTKRYDRKALQQDETGDVWIVLGEDYLGDIPRVLDFGIKNENGDITNFKVASTWLPINLAEWVNKVSILRDTAILQLERRGVLQFIDPEEAYKILQSPEGKRELAQSSVKTGTMSIKAQAEESSNPQLQFLLNSPTANRTDMDRFFNRAELTAGDINSIARSNNQSLKDAYQASVDRKAGESAQTGRVSHPVA